MDIVSLFNSVRDIPYRIPLDPEEEDRCCSGKHEKLFNLLKKEGFKVRYRVCVFLWSSLKLPKKIEKIPHEDDCTHVYLEIMIWKKWKVLDATWDSGLKNVFHVNEWDGKSGMQIAVKPVKIFSPNRSMQIVRKQNKDVIKKDLRINGKFYRAFNEWLEQERK